MEPRDKIRGDQLEAGGSRMSPREVRSFLKLVAAAFVLILTLQVVGRLMPVSRPGEDSALDVEAALLSLQELHGDLSVLQARISTLQVAFNSSAVPVLTRLLQSTLPAIGLDAGRISRMNASLAAKEKKIREACEQIRDDLESLLVKVNFIQDDLTHDLSKVVPSALEYLEQFVKDLDLAFKNQGSSVRLAAMFVVNEIRRALRGHLHDAGAVEVQAQLTSLGNQFRPLWVALEVAKVKYNTSKGRAIGALAAVV